MRRAKEGTASVLVRMALPWLRGAERACPRTGPGERPTIPDWAMAGWIMIGILFGRKSKAAQYGFLTARRREFGRWLEGARFPSRTTFYRRYRRAHRLYQEAIRLQGERAIAEGIANPEVVAVDKSLVAARGAPWHVRQQKAGHRPRGADAEAAWGYSEHDGWVYGYSYEVLVTATDGSRVFPLLASAETASASEVRSLLAKLPHLPAATRFVTADAGYDANYLGEGIEYDPQGRRTGRRFLCPENPRYPRPKTRPGGADAARAPSRERRCRRARFLKSRHGRQLYARRRTIEPFNHWFKAFFELEERVWHRGRDNNCTQLLVAIFLYQLLVRYNHHCGHHDGCITWIKNAL